MTHRKVAISLAALILLQVVAPSQAATPTAKPKPHVTTTKKSSTPKKVATKKPVTKKSATSKTAPAKKLTTPKKKASSTSKKVTAPKKKSIVRKYVYRAPVRKAIQPSPSPKWPPAGFTSVGTAYARVPTGTELLGILSAFKDSSKSINSCAVDPKSPSSPAFSCAAILVGSTERCTWWKISTTITGIDPANPPGRVPLGTFVDIVSGAAAKTIQTIIMVSPVPLAAGVKFTELHALCGIGSTTDTVPSTTFTPAPAQSPTPSDSPVPTETVTPANA